MSNTICWRRGSVCGGKVIKSRGEATAISLLNSYILPVLFHSKYLCLYTKITAALNPAHKEKISFFLWEISIADF